MITNYEDFITENNISDGITEEEYELLKKYNIENYVFNKKTGMIDIDGDIRTQLNSKGLKDLPNIRFGHVSGEFGCTNNFLTSLKNAPKTVGGWFHCSYNRLTDLEYSPTEVIGFNCCNNKITSLEGCTQKVIDSFHCSNNKLTSLEHCPKNIKNSFNCDKNLLTSLEYCPLTCKHFSCVGNKLTSLEHCPKILEWGIDCDENRELINLDHCPKFTNSFSCKNIPALYKIENYPLCIIGRMIENNTNEYYDIIRELVMKKREIYEHLLNDKVRFHQQIMRDEPSLIKHYTTITPPSKKSIL